MSRGVLVVLGSGETAPGMTKVHREALSRLSPLRAVNLDTSYGFQLNVPQMSEKLEQYFSSSLHVDLETLHFTSYARSTEIERTLFKQRVRDANYVFAGPGSPTYALAQWSPLRLQDDLESVLDADGTLCFASAAALTLGAFTAPIYEVYKVGTEEPRWHAGLDLLAAFGLRCAVIPHFDNAEGGNYDTRFCYLGEPRLLDLEGQLPQGVATLGVDEHTALIIDRERDTLTVRGRAHGHWRLNGETRVLENATTTGLEELRFAPVQRTTSSASAPSAPRTTQPLALAEIAAHGGGDANEALARLVQLAQAGGEGRIEPTKLIDGILAIRREARALGLYEIADQLRDCLIGAGVEVQDGPQGSTWSLSET